MNSIVIGKSGVAYSAKIGGGLISGINEINSLADGAIAVFTAENEMVTAANVATILIDKKGIYIAVGSGSATLGAYTSIITRRLGANYEKKAYVAPVKQVQVIGYDGVGLGALNLPTLVAGEEAYVKITDTTTGFRTIGSVYTNEVKSYSYVLRTGDDAEDVIDALVAAINNDADSVVVAVKNGTPFGITLTHKNYGGTFDIALDGILINTTITKDGTGTVDFAVVYGEGTSDQILAFEDFVSAERGNTNRIQQSNLWYSVPSKVVSGATYDQYNISWTGRHEREIGSQTTVNHQLVVAIPNGATQQALFETIMAQVFGVAEEEESGA